MPNHAWPRTFFTVCGAIVLTGPQPVNAQYADTTQDAENRPFMSQQLPGLFEEVFTLNARQAAVAEIPEHGDGATRWRAVQINPNAFKYFRTSEGKYQASDSNRVSLGTIKLNLFQNEELLAKNRYITDRSDGGYDWAGTVVGTCEGCSRVFLHIDKTGNIWGSIHVDGAIYEIKPTVPEQGLHVLYQINPATIEPFNDTVEEE